jgi:hypothetical protein
MKQDFEFRPAESPPDAPASDGTLDLIPVIESEADGTPILEGQTGGSVLALDPVPQGTDGALLAVCKRMGTDGRVAVLGYVPAATAAVAGARVAGLGDIVLRTGRSMLRLTPDGRIRIKADDMTLDSNGRLALSGAFIDLN